MSTTAATTGITHPRTAPAATGSVPSPRTAPRASTTGTRPVGTDPVVSWALTGTPAWSGPLRALVGGLRLRRPRVMSARADLVLPAQRQVDPGVTRQTMMAETWLLRALR